MKTIRKLNTFIITFLALFLVIFTLAETAEARSHYRNDGTLRSTWWGPGMGAGAVSYNVSGWAQWNSSYINRHENGIVATGRYNGYTVRIGSSITYTINGRTAGGVSQPQWGRHNQSYVTGPGQWLDGGGSTRNVQRFTGPIRITHSSVPQPRNEYGLAPATTNSFSKSL